MEREKLRQVDFNLKSNEELLAEYKKTGALEIKQELAVRYLYIVKSIAIQMRDVYLSFSQVDDIIHEGVIIVMNAIDKFQPDMNVKFETYISKRIRGMIIDLARKQDWVPRTVRKNAKDIEKATNELYTRLGRNPSDQEIAEYLGVDEERFQKMMSRTNLFYVLSLDMILEEASENKKSFQLSSDDEREQPEQSYLENEFKEILESGIASLKENEQKVISLYYVEELNMKEIAKVMQVSEPRISQIHSRALQKLKQHIDEYRR